MTALLASGLEKRSLVPKEQTSLDETHLVFCEERYKMLSDVSSSPVSHPAFKCHTSRGVAFAKRVVTPHLLC